MVKILEKVMGTPQDRIVKKYKGLVQRVNDLEPEYQKLTDEELRGKTEEFKKRLTRGHDLDDIMPESFAAVREAAKRTIGQRHYDVQLIGGAVLHSGNIAEMKTGEGKTLVATLPSYLNALTGKGVHVVTVNDYLARRDPVWMGPIFHMLGVSVGCLQHESSFMYDPSVKDGNPSYHSLKPISRHEAYRTDITYGTNNEFGFDYLRDNMALDTSRQVQAEMNYAIVDEVDNILVDEARTPLIISGPAQEPVQLYYTMAQLAPRLRPEEDFTIDEKTRAISITEEGVDKVERWLKVENIYAPENFHLVQYLENAIRAHVTYLRDREYVVKDGEVIIVDEFTGRLQPGRRWSDGLHQAVEAKEGLKVQRESVTYATITLQNYFRMYKKLAGMTGTALTEAEEFLKIYRLDVVPIPTNVPMVRKDHSDLIFQTEQAKWKAVVKEIEEMQKQGRPVLVGTTSVEKSERLSEMLRRKGVKHEVLNAKNHEREAQIVAQAGRPGTVTVSTNMAGRGTDIILGGNLSSDPSMTKEQWEQDHKKIIEMGGLHVVGTEHHEARRIDNQLRGRSGRQGDPGSTQFYASMEDEIIRRFGGERAKNMMQSVSRWAGISPDDPLESGMIGKLIGSAQSKVEGYHFEIRKHLLEYDDVLNQQRAHIYAERKKILSGTDFRESVLNMVKDALEELVNSYLSASEPEDWNSEGFIQEVNGIMPPPADLSTKEQVIRLSPQEIKDKLWAQSESVYAQREQEQGVESMRVLERLVMLRSLDLHWVQHLTNMERLRQGVGLQAYAQRDPLTVYRTEGRKMYDELLARMRHDVVHSIYRVYLKQAPGPEEPTETNGKAKVEAKGRSEAKTDGAAKSSRLQATRPEVSPMAAMARRETATVTAAKIGRNDPCYCGSGKKYKRCHGAS